MRLLLNQPVTQSTPELEVDGLTKPGAYRFRLEVVDSAGNRSLPAEVRVVVGPVEVREPVNFRRVGP